MSHNKEHEYLLKLGCKDGISQVCFSPTGSAEANSKSLLLVSSWDCSVSLHDVQSNSLMCQYRHPAAVLSCCFGTGSSSKELFSGSLDRTVRKYDMETQVDVEFGRHDNAVRCVSYSMEAGVVVSGSWDKTIKIWDSKRVGNKNVQAIQQPDKVFAMDVFGYKVIVGHAGRTLRIYDLRKLDSSIDPAGTQTHSESPLKYQTRCVKVFPDQTAYAVGSIEGRVGVEYFKADPDSKSKFAFRCHRSKDKDGNEVINPVNAIAFHPTYGTFATGGCDGLVNIWDAKNKKKLCQFARYDTSISSLDFNSDGSKLAIASSYTYERGELRNPIPDSIIIRNIQDEDVKPKPKIK